MRESMKTGKIDTAELNIKEEDMQLIPAIVQDYKNGEVLMLAYMNRQALKKSITSGTTWFWSRSRKELWNKGATSGNKQLIKEIWFDCDSDALLVKVQQKGVACHTGNRSCFYNNLTETMSGKGKKASSMLKVLRFTSRSQKSPENILDELYSVISERIESCREDSYTYNLHKKGIDEILKKMGEESVEIILSSKHQSKRRTVSEISDFIYHLIVLMVEKKIKMEEIYSELKSRRK
jgi:phosphoribosyl-ATP pyrophosphohydrolase/phosphoribosyl-AMP cyclohydrolase